MKPIHDPSQLHADRQKWQKVFDALVGIINQQQSQLQTLVRERKVLEDRIRTQKSSHDSDVAFLKDRISQMKGDLAVQDMMRSLDARKLELAVGLKQREALLHKLKLGESQLELADFKDLLDILSANCPTQKDASQQNPPETSRSKRSRRESGRKSRNELHVPNHALENEISRLKNEYDTLISEKNAEVSALLAEKKFVWNQYNVLETNLNGKLKTKEAEVRLANEKVFGLLASMEKLQSSNDEKVEVISELETKLADNKETMRKKDDEITRLAHELELLRRRVRRTSDTPMLSRCTTSGSTASLGNKKGAIIIREPSTASQVSDSTGNSTKGRRTSTRKAGEANLCVATPKLFSPKFNLPKMKTPSTHMR